MKQAERLDAYLAEHCTKIQDAFRSVASHTYGVVSYYYCISPEISRNQHGFFYSKVGKTGFYEQKPLDAAQLDPEDLEHNTWYFTPIRRGRPSWVGPYPDQFLGEILSISYLTPIYKSGTLVGVMGMDIPFDTLIEQISPIRVYETGYACLMDSEGQILYHPYLEPGSMPDLSGQDIQMDMFQQKDSGGKLIRYIFQGEKRQMAFSTLSNGMKLVVTAPEREITASWHSLTRIILLATAVIILIFATIILFVVGILIRPLQQLTAASRKLADGNYEIELTSGSKDEVGMLTSAFIQMWDNLKSYIIDLNRRIYTDNLTGLPNMGYFFRLAEIGRNRLIGEGKNPVILFFNLIGMKYYNRQYSFQEGNSLICHMPEILAGHYGRECCSRFGQDHFAAYTDEEGLEETLKEIFHELEQFHDGRTLPVRVGIYQDRMGAVDASSACDRAKYASDQQRGSYVSAYYYFDENMLIRIENYRYIINNLDRAIREHWIQVYYQPIVRAKSGMICDEEALSRWIDPIKGFLSPGEFIPILEGARLIYKLDLYVLDQILLKMQRQQQEGLYVVPQSLNLSRMDFDSCDIIAEICQRMDQAGISRDKLTIEITESVVGSDFEFIRKQIQKLQELGFKVWMDDFGSGYSSLDVLQDIHFDLIKFDMRFMHRFGEGDESRIILTELIHMAIALGIDTLAEGVETKEQADFLRETGCTRLQGFYYSKAISLEEILKRSREKTLPAYENPDMTH